MRKTIFLYSGEGTNNSESSFKLIKQTPSWTKIEALLNDTYHQNLEQLWHSEMGNHCCPESPLLTLVAQICLSELWQQWGYRPDAVTGHSTGELAAAYQAGLYSLEQIIQLADRIGKIGARLNGMMVHGALTDPEIAHLSVPLSSFNFAIGDKTHVTLCGLEGELDEFLAEHPDFVRMKIPHPWHHPDYGQFAEALPRIDSANIEAGTFLSGVTARFETRLSHTHWQEWLVKPIDFIKTLGTLKGHFGDTHLEIIEIGFHPVLEKCCEVLAEHLYTSSMFRGEDEVQWIMFQRRKLDPERFLEKLQSVIESYSPGLDYDKALAYQGFNSLKFTEFSVLLQPFFPTLAPHDFYRYKSINQLIANFGTRSATDKLVPRDSQRHAVVITGMSCRFPSTAQTVPEFWNALLSGTDQVGRTDGRGRSQAGWLDAAHARFDHRYFNIPQAEAGTMDPQQILALELSELLWLDAGIDPEALNKQRVGVYLGVWNQEYRGDHASVYYPSGTNPSIIAARISYHYDLRGPSWVANTACSSSLVAVHYAAKDIEAGRIDFAIAGGVNMLLDEGFSDSMRNAGFLSRDDRCKAFDDNANGYARAEGGGLVLLANKALVSSYYAEVKGSAINQNGGRSQLLTAPHPEAQEEVILGACQDAGISPREIAYVECHGTGTKIGDPIEIAAIQNTIGHNRSTPCYLGAVKSNIGHLESAAGIAGLIKAVAAVNHGLIPPNLHFQKPNQYIDFESGRLQVVTTETRLDRQAKVGISSFGFGGSNAHLVIQGAEDALRKELAPIRVPFDRLNATPLDSYIRHQEAEIATAEAASDVESDASQVRDLIQALIYQVTGVNDIDPHLELIEQGLDSMSATELLRTIEEKYHIELEPEVLFEYPLIDQFTLEIEKRIAG